MCEVTAANFIKLYPKIEASLKDAKFIALDTEFSALNPPGFVKHSLFDSLPERYRKVRLIVEQIIPVQIGLTAFKFDPDKYKYVADTYTFYVFPRPFANIDHTFLFQASSLQFLSNHKFDFNKYVNGVSFKNRADEQKIREMFDSNSLVSDHNLRNELETIVDDADISKWYYSANITDIKVVPNVITKFSNNYEILYSLHSQIRKNYANVWTYIDNDCFLIKKVSAEEFIKLSAEHDLKEDLLENIIGISRIFKLIAKLKVPLIGHNFFTDLMLILHCFEEDLPKSYTKFKRLVHTLYPTIYDTKTCSYNLKKKLETNKAWKQNTLPSLYEYFKDGHGRHIALNSPLIEPSSKTEFDDFHNAGYDSYCTGYIFIRMAHIENCLKDPEAKKRNFMFCELQHSMENSKNAVNVIKCSVSKIQLDGNDPISERPPFLIVESLKNRPVNIGQITHLLSGYGFIEVQQYSSKGHCAIVAVDNFGSARRILQQFRTHTDYRIRQYNFIKHSPMARTFLWSGVLASGVICAWFAHSIFTKK